MFPPSIVSHSTTSTQEYYKTHTNDYQKDLNNLAQPKRFHALSIDTSGKLVERWSFSLLRLIDTLWSVMKGYSFKNAVRDFGDAKVILGPKADDATVHVKIQEIAQRAGIKSTDAFFVNDKKELMKEFNHLLKSYLDQIKVTNSNELSSSDVIKMLDDRDQLTKYMMVVVKNAEKNDDIYKLDKSLVTSYQEVSIFIATKLKEKFRSPTSSSSSSSSSKDLDLHEIGKKFRERIRFLEKENSIAYKNFDKLYDRFHFDAIFTGFERHVTSNMAIAFFDKTSKTTNEQKAIIRPYILPEAWMIDTHNYSSIPNIGHLVEDYEKYMK